MAVASKIAAARRSVLQYATNRTSVVHGETHWRSVALAAHLLGQDDPSVDRLVCLLFALTHDSMRHDDGVDPGHGPRAAATAHRLIAERAALFGDLDDRQAGQLTRACEIHNGAGPVSDDRTVAVCLDADRLMLWRVGVIPDPKLLSTRRARHRQTIAWAREICDTPSIVPSWRQLAELLDDARPLRVPEPAHAQQILADPPCAPAWR